MARAVYFMALDRIEEAVAEWRLIVRHGGGDRAAGTLVAILYKENRCREALEVTAFHYSTWAFNSNRKATLQAVEEIGPDASPFFRFWKHHSLTLCGNREEALEGLKSLRASEEELPSWLQTPLRLFLDEAEPVDILEEAGEYKHHLAAAHFYIALVLLAKGDRTQAENHFRQCVECNAFMGDRHQWAQGYLAQMIRDPGWPASLTESP
jgi:tetratricopeptide (TPR) repeat protein